MRRAEPLRRLLAATEGEQSAVIADASAEVGSVEAVYELLKKEPM